MVGAIYWEQTLLWWGHLQHRFWQYVIMTYWFWWSDSSFPWLLGRVLKSLNLDCMCHVLQFLDVWCWGMLDWVINMHKPMSKHWFKGTAVSVLLHDTPANSETCHLAGSWGPKALQASEHFTMSVPPGDPNMKILSKLIALTVLSSRPCPVAIFHSNSLPCMVGNGLGVWYSVK